MRSCTFSITVPLQFRASHAAKFLSNRTTSGIFTLQAYHQRILKFGEVTAGGRLGSLCSRRWASIVHKMVPPATTVCERPVWRRVSQNDAPLCRAFRMSSSSAAEKNSARRTFPMNFAGLSEIAG